MVAVSLVLARDSAPAPVDLDALVGEAERLYRFKGGGTTEENIRAFRLFLQAAEAGHSQAQFYAWLLLSLRRRGATRLCGRG